MKTPAATMLTPNSMSRPGCQSRLKSKFKRSLICAALAAVIAPGLNAAAITWVSGNDGDWTDTANWQGGVPPATGDSVLVDSGTVRINSNIATGISGTSAATGTTAIGLTAGQSSALIIATGGNLINDNRVFSVGEAGNGYLEIQSGGTLQTGGYIYANQIGNLAGSSGTVVIKDGGVWASYGGIYAGNYGTGLLHVETGGTLTIDAASLYLGERAGGSGTTIIDGYFRSGTAGTIYMPIGKNSTTESVLILGTTGTIFSGRPEVGMSGQGKGRAEVYGHWEISGGNTRIGGTGTSVGVLNVHPGAFMNFNGGGLLISSSVASSGTVNISGTVINVGTLYVGETSNKTATLNIAAGGYLAIPSANSWFGRNAGAANAVNIANIDGTWLTGGYMNANVGTYILNIGQTGIVRVGEGATGIRFGGAVNSSGTITVAGLLEATDGPISVGHTRQTAAGSTPGSATIFITTTGTVISGGGESALGNLGFGSGATITSATGIAHVDGVWLNGGDFSVGRSGNGYLYLNSTGTVTALNLYIGRHFSGTAGSHGYAYVDGVMAVANAMQIGANGHGELRLSSAATITTGGNVLFANGASALASGSIAGVWTVGGDFIVGNSGKADLELRASSNVTVAGNYRQNSLSTLTVELDSTRTHDPIDPSVPSALISVGGAATLSGTLNVYGPGVADITYTGNGEGNASDLTGYPILRAIGGITGDFDRVVITGGADTSTLPDFIRLAGVRVTEVGALPTRYDVAYGLAWNALVEQAHGNFTIESGKTLNVDTQLRDRPGIAFGTGWDGLSLTKMGPGTLILGVENTYTGTTTIQSGTLRFAGPPQHILGALVNDGVLDFGTSGTTANAAQRTIRATSLAGSGTYHMTINMGEGTSDRLIIAGDAVGTHRLLITNTGTGSPTGNEPTLTLISVGGVYDMDYNEEITTAGGTFYGNFDYGMFNYKIDTQNGKVVIVNTGLLSHIADPISGVPGAQSLLWFDHLDNVSRRFGELRLPREGQLGLDIWARGHAASATIGGGTTETRLSDVDMWGAEMGTDYTWKLDDQRASLGVYVGTGNTSQDFKTIPVFDPLSSTMLAYNATGESDLLGLGVYGAWFSDAGWFANVTASLAQYKNSFDYTDASNNHTTADYKDNGYGLTAEIGRRIAIGEKGWFVEPAVQGSIARLTRADYTTTGYTLLPIQGTDVTLNRLRGALRLGRGWQTRAGFLELVGRVAATRERSTGGEMNIGSANRWRPNLDGNRFEAGVSAFWQIGGAGQLYADYEYSAGDNFEKPWAISLGFRLSL